MMDSFSRVPVIILSGIFLLLMIPNLKAQTSQSEGAQVKTGVGNSFTQIFDSKIAREDSDLIVQMIEKSAHADFIKRTTGSEIYILDLDNFRNGLPACKALGKSLHVISKAELKSMNAPFFVTVDNYNNQQAYCRAGITLHVPTNDGFSSDSKTVIIDKTTSENKF